jgi:hypothetical protein
MNQATIEFIRGCYYYLVGNPIYYIHRANACRAAGFPVNPKDDFLDEIIAERSIKNPDFLQLVNISSNNRKKKMQLIPRKVGFDSQGFAVGAGFGSHVNWAHHHEVMLLPSKHIDFIDFDVRDKTKQQIETEVAALMQEN